MAQEGTSESLSVARQGLTCPGQNPGHSQDRQMCAAERRLRRDAVATWARKGQQCKTRQNSMGSSALRLKRRPALQSRIMPDRKSPACFAHSHSGLEKTRLVTPCQGLCGLTHSVDGTTAASHPLSTPGKTSRCAALPMTEGNFIVTLRGPEKYTNAENKA